MSKLPPVAKGFDATRFLGTWHIVSTNYGFWKRRIQPAVTYGALTGTTFSMTDELSFRVRSRFGGDYRPKTLRGIDREDGEPGRFVWRGAGLLGVIRSPWCVVRVGQDYDWAVTYFARSNVGTAPGVDIYARATSLAPRRVAEILRELRDDPFMARASEGMFDTMQVRQRTADLT